jgi:hypothetical protein
MKNNASDIIKVLFATAVALCLVLVVVRFTRGQSEIGGPLRADSALALALNNAPVDMVRSCATGIVAHRPIHLKET